MEFPTAVIDVRAATWTSADKTMIRVDAADGATFYVPDDPDNAERAALTRQNVVIAAYVAPPPSVPDEISDRQFFQALAVQGLVTEDEALAAVMTGTLPAKLAGFIAQLPADQQFAARMALCGAVVFHRRNPFTEAFIEMNGWTDDQGDDFWRFASTL